MASSWRNKNYNSTVLTLKKVLPQHTFYNFKDPLCSCVFQWSEIDKDWKNWSAYKFRNILDKDYKARKAFISDKIALDWCDICVLILPCGRSAHIELGYAVGRGKITTILLTKDFEPELMYKYIDHLAIDLQDLIDFLKRCMI